MIIAQRLARKLCQDCKALTNIPEHALVELGFSPEEIPRLKIYEPQGCGNCKEGYRGRIGIYEVMPITAKIGGLILKGANVFDIGRQALEDGVWNLRKAGLNKVKMGFTSIAELQRVTKD
ncbi:MAG: hypothetical protein ACKOAD_05545 [Gammaproteobacteria bacterium]